MKSLGPLLVSLLFLVIAVVAAIYLYPQLPLQVATHWDAHGVVDGYASRNWVVLMPLMMIVLLALLAVVLPRLSPHRFGMDGFAPVWHLAMLAAQGLVLVLAVAILLHGAGYAVPVPKVTLLGAGVFFMVIGNYMGKLRRNFFIGIRTPWTLSSEAVWERTHRLAGWLFVVGGALAALVMLLGLSPWLAILLLLVAALLPVLYSLLIYRQYEARH